MKAMKQQLEEYKKLVEKQQEMLLREQNLRDFDKHFGIQAAQVYFMFQDLNNKVGLKE